MPRRRGVGGKVDDTRRGKGNFNESEGRDTKKKKIQIQKQKEKKKTNVRTLIMQHEQMVDKRGPSQWPLDGTNISCNL